MQNRAILLAVSLSFVFASPAPAAAASVTEKLQVGRFSARAILTYPKASALKRSAVILIPGSGATGPEEAIPGDLTLSGKDEAVFDQLARPFHDQGIVTLQLGKPGIEFQGAQSPYYDEKTYNELTWPDYLAHIGDAAAYLAARADVDPARIYLLGHSEGTVAAVDYAELANAGKAAGPAPKGVLLLGYVGEDFKSVVTWQLIDREIDLFLKPDADANHDGRVSHEEALVFTDSYWSNFIPAGTSLSYDELRAKLWEFRGWTIPRYEAFPLWMGIFDRGSNYDRTASLPQDVFVLNGELDAQTPASQSLLLGEACKAKKKPNCEVTILPGLGHGFSEPRGPRKQPFLDMTIGPVDKTTADTLAKLAQRIR